MSIYQESKVDLVAWINKKAGVTFAATDFIFSPPAVNDNPATSTKNTKLRITVVPERAGYKGTSVIYYDRLSLAKLADFPVPDYPPTGGVGQSVYDLLARIKTATGIPFTSDDLEETFVEDDGANGRVLLKAKATSLGWIGQFYLVLGAKPSFAALFKTDSINWSS
jgi:hypothetical protein